MITEQEILNKLKEGVVLHPMTFLFMPEQPKLYKSSIIPDAFVEGTWKGPSLNLTERGQSMAKRAQSFTFATEIKRYSSPKTISQAIYAAKQTVRAWKSLWPESPWTENQIYPLVITPWLSWENLMLLESELVSGIDLNGNGVIVLPGINVRRAGQRNAYPDSRLVRNVYSGNTSLVARVFLLRPSFTSVQEIVQEIEKHNGEITQPTVSKALKQLEEDLIISKEKENIRLIQPEKLLERLSAEFSMPKVQQTMTLAIAPPTGQALYKAANNIGTKIALTGTSSANFIVGDPMASFYCNAPLANLIKALKEPPDLNSRFPNVRLIETEDPTAYFDSQYNKSDGVTVSSLVQSWLELNAGDGRQKEAAAKIKQVILDNLEQQEWKK